MGESPKFEHPTTPEEERALELERSKYMLEHIANQDEHIANQNEKYSKDALTGLKPRWLFDDELEQAIRLVHRGMEAALIAIDIDHFKEVNDGPDLGHPAGDEVLRRVASILKESVREADIAARYGGDELMVLLSGADTLSAAAKAEKIRAKIAELSFEDVYPGLKVTASLGVIALNGLTDAEEAKKLVDVELYRAKNGGRNRVEVQGIENIT